MSVRIVVTVVLGSALFTGCVPHDCRTARDLQSQAAQITDPLLLVAAQAAVVVECEILASGAYPIAPSLDSLREAIRASLLEGECDR